MNLNDFVVVTNKPKSMKLKARNLGEMKLETVQLELESKDMESRLQQLRQSMSREKEERKNSEVYHWKSGQAGRLSNQTQGPAQNKENSFQKFSVGNMKVKVLKDQPEEFKKTLAKQQTSVSLEPSRKTKLKGKDCGQCESKKAGVMCVECGEDYCIGCFARFHQKGALKFHRMIPIQMEIQTSVSTLDVVSQFKKQIDPEESAVKTKQRDAVMGKQSPVRNPSPEINRNAEILTLDPEEEFENPDTSDETQSLLSGAFDEAESANSFQEVLMEWRASNGRNNQNWKPLESLPVSTEVSAVQADLVQERKPIDIEFREHSLSYMEKLLLKKHRRTPVEQYQAVSSVTSFQRPPVDSKRLIDEEGLSLTAEELEIHRYCVSLFTEKKIDQYIQRTESRLSVLELDEVLEDHLEKRTYCVVQEEDSKEKEAERTGGGSPELHGLLETEELTGNKEIKQLKKLEMCTPSLQRTPLSSGDRTSLSPGNAASVKTSRQTPLKDSSEMERRAHEYPQKPKQRQRQRTEKQTESSPVNSHTCTPTASLLLDMHFEDSPSTSENGSNPNHWLESSSPTDLGLTLQPSKALHSLAQRTVMKGDQYCGLNGFLTLGLEPESICPDPFPPQTSLETGRNEECLRAVGKEDWRPSSSFTEQADESVVSSVIGSVWSRPLSSPQQLIYAARTDSSTQRQQLLVENEKLLSTAKKESKSSRSAGAATRPLSRAAVEISEIESIDCTENDDPYLEDEAAKYALASLEEEFKMLVNDKDVIKSLHDPHVYQSQNGLRSQNHMKTFSTKSWDVEGHTDDEDEEILRDKQNVMSLI
ncbi:zinc finger B-box domain-containing protein 1 isoform X2 [Lepisosteus oculatus]|uniref:zinc finger B-box domain-containing protein 1 isoform X2 n=1 Tax=Lepisosteus oculatus TaxID=7918 RepID=UPI0035F51EA0